MDRTDTDGPWHMEWEYPASTTNAAAEDTPAPEEPENELWTPGDELDLTSMDVPSELDQDLFEDTDSTVS